ncbi:MAG TPA: TolC family protein [Bacteroidota bacterium]|nr:TolC family protein [Bacteroidota bacterium]
MKFPTLRRMALAVVLWTPVGATATNAQESISLSIDQAISTGIENSKSLHASLMNVEYTDARSGEVNAQRLAQIKLSGGYTRLSEIPPAEIGPYPPLFKDPIVISPSLLNNYTLRLSLQQPLFTGFRLQGASDMAEYTAQAASADYRLGKSDLVFAIRSAYWNVYKAKEFKKVIDENVAQMEAHRKDVQSMFDQGIITKNELLKVEVQLSNTRVLQLDAGNNVRLATIALDNLIGLPVQTGVEIASTIQTDSTKYSELTGLVEKAIANRDDVHAMEYRVKAAESGVSVARSGWFPQVYVTGNYYYSRPNQRYFPALDQFQDTWDVSLGVSLDVWNWGTTIRQTNQANAQLEEAKDQEGLLRDGVTLEVTQNYLNLHESLERIAVSDEAVKQAEENYRITNEKFLSGLALNSDVLDAEVALLQAKWNHIRALVDHELAGARLQKAVGEDPNVR